MTPPQAARESPNASLSTTLECYLSAIQDIAEAIENIAPQLAPSYYEQLQRLRARLATDSSAEALHECRAMLHRELKAFTDAYLQQVNQIADPLTGIGNRREYDRELALRIEAKIRFCMLLFDLDHFKMVNDQHGHLCGDEVLKQLGARLRGQIRSRDFVCRWGGDEFVVILECGLADAEIRSRQIAEWISGPYKVRVEGKETIVDVGVSVGSAEYTPGETPEQLFKRVDASLYSRKKQ